MQEMGQLNVNDPISKYLTDYPEGNSITIHHLLTHSSGIPSITRLSILSEIQRQKTTPFLAMNHFKDLPKRFAPGTDCEYSDSGYIVLGAIIEKVANKPYETVLIDNIFKPLGMEHTYYEYNESVIPNRASGYILLDGVLKHAPFIDMSLPHAAGALSTTVEDLYKFDQALKGTPFLTKEMLQTLFTIHASNTNNQIASGYGFRVGPLNRGMDGSLASIVGHFGTIDGFESAFIRYLRDDLTIILLSNVEKTDLRQFQKDLHSTLCSSCLRSSWR